MKKIVVIGPESTGKSTLCEQLAHHYQTLWVPEYARAYLLQHGMDYTYDDLLTIAQGQVALEDAQAAVLASRVQVAAHPVPLLIDTNLYVMKVWCEFVFGKCHSWIKEEIDKRKYDLYLFCNIDLPWVKDELREYPDLESREELYSIYKKILIEQLVPWIEISGNYEQRFNKAVTGINALLA